MFRYLLLIGIIGLIAILVLGIYNTHPIKMKLMIWLLLISSILMIIFDSYLTGLAIVMYNDNAILPIKLGTIPIEDFGYLIIVNLVCPALFETFSNGKK